MKILSVQIYNEDRELMSLSGNYEDVYKFALQMIDAYRPSPPSPSKQPNKASPVNLESKQEKVHD